MNRNTGKRKPSQQRKPTSSKSDDKANLARDKAALTKVRKLFRSLDCPQERHVYRDGSDGSEKCGGGRRVLRK